MKMELLQAFITNDIVAEFTSCKANFILSLFLPQAYNSTMNLLSVRSSSFQGKLFVLKRRCESDTFANIYPCCFDATFVLHQMTSAKTHGQLVLLCVTVSKKGKKKVFLLHLEKSVVGGSYARKNTVDRKKICSTCKCFLLQQKYAELVELNLPKQHDNGKIHNLKNKCHLRKITYCSQRTTTFRVLHIFVEDNLRFLQNCILFSLSNKQAVKDVKFQKENAAILGCSHMDSPRFLPKQHNIFTMMPQATRNQFLRAFVDEDDMWNQENEHKCNEPKTVPKLLQKRTASTVNCATYYNKSDFETLLYKYKRPTGIWSGVCENSLVQTVEQTEIQEKRAGGCTICEHSHQHDHYSHLSVKSAKLMSGEIGSMHYNSIIPLNLVQKSQQGGTTSYSKNEECIRIYVHEDQDQFYKNTAPPTSDPSSNTFVQHETQNSQMVSSDSPGSPDPLAENARRETFRLSSFQHYSLPINARQFAGAGFYYNRRDNEIKCFACSNVLRNPSARTDPYLLSMHTPTCRFARDQDECGNERLGRSEWNGSLATGSAQTPAGGGVTSGAPPLHRGANVMSAPAPRISFAAQPRVRLASSTNTGPLRHYEGLDIRNYQSARPVAPPRPSTYDVPLHRQLATIQSPSQARLIRSLNLCRETHRYQTFNSDWPLDSAPSGREMAASGWFYLGNLDRTQCFSCGGVLRNWRRLDNPNTEHMSHFPHCVMAQGREIRNIPDTGRRGHAPNRSALTELTAQQRSDLRIMFPCEFPVTPNMRSVRDRVNTFNNWHFTRATPQTLAEAGFHSLGVRDRVKCFYCNGGLQNWRQDDNPWEEHAKWYPTCEFLLQQRGPEYIHTIVARFPNINRPILHAPGHDVPPAPQVESGPEILPPPPPERPADAQTSQVQAQDRLEIAIQSEVAAVVIGMGFDESLVRDVMRANIEEHGVGYQTATALFDAVEAEQNVRDAEEIRNPPPPIDHNLPELFSFDEEVMEEEEETEDIYESGIDPGFEGMSHSGFPSTPFASNVAVSSTQSLGRFGPVQASTPLPSATERPNIMDTTIESSLPVAQPMRPEVMTSLPHSQEPSTSRIVDQRLRLPSRPVPTDEERTMKLKKQLQELTDECLCKVCLDKRADMVFIPCGHICCCMECTRALRLCPICRKKIEQAVRTYSS